ncbi:uncharacterized protein HMPREF1541_05835 [Cyphellophora europaea CBS 101466]|uniref:NUDE domain-containing protein n=1 Tax=Cyphellophora europaea (strain CBS 101466) TaxID=1220924 RepID=W2RV75_CYPE1|nr:uncharacterized protein HMPREF1541_05835 [Cyphellophora europaea CBS 101466]ETN39609.1 hypothetical protein HMPREF1541_05835 [Cyphellophora europaea CBS 101466]
MPSSDMATSSPGPGTSLEDNLRYYKAQYELLESELADFQASSKELEAELEKDIEASEKRERQLKDKASNLQYEVDEWKAKYKQAKSEASSAQSTLQKEITELRDTNRTLQLRLRDTEVANDDYERQQRNTESSLEDMESKYNQTLERSVMLEEEMRAGEQEREALRIEAQRLKDEFSDYKIEADIVREKLAKAEASLTTSNSQLSIEPVAVSASPRSELSPTTTDTSFDTPPAKTSSSGVSDTPTPPSPPVSERSAVTTKSKTSQPFTTPSIPRVRTSLNGSIPTPRQPTYPRPNASGASHTRGPSIPAISRTGPSGTGRQSFGSSIPQRSGLPQSSSIMHLRNLRSKMQNLEARVHTARSKLPGPVNTPPKASPRSGSALGNHAIPASVTVRSRKRAGGSTISGASQPDSDSTPSVPRTKPSRPSLGQSYSRDMPPPTPTGTSFATSQRGEMAAPPSRPDSRTSTSRHSFIASHSRPGSRASVSNLRGFGNGSQFAPNASTDRVRPKSALSSHGFDGAMDDSGVGDDSIIEDAGEDAFDTDGRGANSKDLTTPTPRRTSFMRPSGRVSDIGSAIPSPVKRTSLGGQGNSRLPAPLGRRQSQTSLPMRSESAQGHRRGESVSRPQSRVEIMQDVQEGKGGYDVNETF